MFGRKFLFLLVLVVALGGPIAVFNKDLRGTISQKWQSLTGGGGKKGPSGTGGVLDPGGIALLTGSPSSAAGTSYTGAAGNDGSTQTTQGTVGRIPPLVGSPVSELGEVIRFDVSPSWVMSRWSQVTTISSDLNVEALRVPLVTGSRIDDLAGSLTYCFDRRQQVQRIQFDGTTGDPRRLVELITRHYRLREEKSLGAGLYLAKWNGKPTSAVRIRYAPVVKATVPHRRLQVKLELNRPDRRYGLSPEFQAILDNDRRTKRW